jgi:hypothetical protein
VRTASNAYLFAQREAGGGGGGTACGDATRVVVVGVRKAAEAKLLSGVDYMILPDTVQRQLQAEATLQGYNDGFSAADTGSSGGVPALNRAAVEAAEFRAGDVAEVSGAEAFQEALGMAGAALLRERLARDSEAAGQIVTMLGHVVVARE